MNATPARPIRTLSEGADTRLPTILLGSKIDRHCLGRAGASPFRPCPQIDIGATGGDALITLLGEFDLVAVGTREEHR
jgi:hypothetical protein